MISDRQTDRIDMSMSPVHLRMSMDSRLRLQMSPGACDEMLRSNN